MVSWSQPRISIEELILNVFCRHTNLSSGIDLKYLNWSYNQVVNQLAWSIEQMSK